MPSKKKASVKRPIPRTVEEKLRGLIHLKIGPAILYTQKEMADILGISTRTLRRFKNVPGHKLSPKTISKIKPIVAKEDRAFKRMIDSGSAFESVKVKGVRGRQWIRVKGPGFKLPPSRILQFPKIYPSANGKEQTLSIDVEGWLTDEKIFLVQSAHSQHRFSSWRYRARMPQGIGYRRGDDFEPGGYVDLSDLGDESKKDVSYFVTEGPFSLHRNLSNFFEIEKRLLKDDDAGRLVVEINLTEFIKKKKKRAARGVSVPLK